MYNRSRPFFPGILVGYAAGVTLSFFVVTVVVYGADNLCPNPGFEGDGPKAWEGTSGHVKWDDEVSHSGQRSAKIFSDGGKTVGWTSDLIPLPKPGCRFVLDGWMKLEDVSGDNRGALMVLYTIGKDKQRNGQTGSVHIIPLKGKSLTTPWTHHVSLSDVLKPDVHYVCVNIRLYGAKGTVWFDDISVRLFEGANIAQPRAIRYDMRFVTNGKPTATIIPGSDGKGPAETIQKAIREATGVVLPIEDASAVTLASDKRDLILLGNLETNACIDYLYRRSYTYADRYFPGAGGYAIRPLINCLGNGTNILVLGASDEEGLRTGAAALTDIIRKAATSGSLSPRIALTVKTGKGYKGIRCFPWSGSPPRREMLPAVQYLKSGDVDFAKAYRALVLKTWFIPDEELFARDHSLHLRYTTKTQSWELMEASGVFSDEERLRITTRLLDMMRSRQGYEYSGLNAGMRSRENHGIRAAKAFYWGWRYFAKYYRKELGVELDLWERKLRGFWQAPLSSSRSYEDSLSQHAFAGSLDNTLTLALCEPEWAKGYFAKGLAKATGERCIAVVNNLGEVVQEGDTSSSDYPADVFAKLAYLYRDGRYLFMLRKRRLGSSSDDPLQGFVVNLEPEVPEDHMGVRVIPADELFYNTVHRGRETVPLEKTFDKLTFRSGFRENDAYLMLDGTARGSHSYDDANTIGEFSENGRIWLCQVDQFNGPTMNFHNAVTLARDGLGMVTVPGCAELITACDGKRLGYTATALRGYNGVDWIRHIFWLKGTCFFVLDELRAMEPANYSFVCSWRGLGEPELQPGLYTVGENVALRAKVRFTASDLLKFITRTSGKNSKLLSNYDSFFYRADAVGDFAEAKLEIPVAGDYEVTLTGLTYRDRGIVRVSFDGQACGEAVDMNCGGRPVFEQFVLGKVHFDKPGKHTVRFEVVGKPDGQKMCSFAIQSLDFFRPGEREKTTLTATRQFFLQFPPETSAGLDRDTEVLGPYLNSHPWHDQVLNVLTQSRTKRLAKGDRIAFQNMFWSVRNGGKALDYRRLNENCAMISNAGQCALLGGGESGITFETEGLSIRAQFFCLDAKGYALVAPRLLQIGDKKLDFAGAQEMKEGTWTDQEQRLITGALAALWQRAAKPSKETAKDEKEKLSTLTAQWNKKLPSPPLSLAIRKTRGDRVIAVGLEDGTVQEYGMDGARCGTFKTGKPVHTLCACDLNRDGIEELLVGSDDEHVYALDADMRPLWKHKVDFLRKQQIWMWWTLGASKVRKIHCDDITGDGFPEVIVGAGNMRLNVLNNKGEPLWRFRTDHGIPTTITTADFLGTGKQEVICGNGLLSSNGSCWVLSDAGKELKKFYNDSWCTTLPAIAFGDTDGDGKPKLFCGNNRGNLRAYDPKGDQRKPLWIQNLAGPIRKIVVLPQSDAAPGLVVVASDSGCLTAFREDGAKAWVATLGAAVVVADLAPDGKIVAGCKDGSIFLVSPAGKPRAVFRADEQLQRMLCGAAGNVVAVTKGHLWMVPMP